MGRIDRWKEIEMTTAQEQTFAEQAAAMRFGVERAKAYKPEALLEVRRPEDEGRSLWRVFNRIQENTTTQSIEGHNSLGRQIRSRPLGMLGLNVTYNEQLWRLADQFAENAA
jgi:hypothetical protein